MENKNLANLKALLATLSEDHLTKDDFVKNFEVIIKLVQKIQQKNEQELQLMQEHIVLLSQKLKEDAMSETTDLRQRVGQAMPQMDKMVAEHQGKMAQIDMKLSSVRNGLDGKNADESKIVKEVVNKVSTPIMKTVEKRLTDFEESLKKTIESSKATETSLSSLRGELSKNRVIYGPGKTRIFPVDLSSQLNGVKKTFFLGTHFGVIAVNSSSAPFGAFLPTTDYTESGKNIVFTSNVDEASALATGQSLIVRILK